MVTSAQHVDICWTSWIVENWSKQNHKKGSFSLVVECESTRQLLNNKKAKTKRKANHADKTERNIIMFKSHAKKMKLQTKDLDLRKEIIIGFQVQFKTLDCDLEIWKWTKGIFPVCVNQLCNPFGYISFYPSYEGRSFSVACQRLVSGLCRLR